MHGIVINNVTGTYKALTDVSEFISSSCRMKNKFHSCSERLLTLQSSSLIGMLIILFILTIIATYSSYTCTVPQSKFEFVIIVS